MYDNLRGVHSSDVDDKQLYEKVIDFKMPFSSRAQCT